jgi:hypothetical protein
VGISIVQENIAAIHRIPGQKDQPKPILVKLRSIEEKTRIMRKRAEIKSLQKGWKIMDDVTKENALLIKKLNQDERISAAWYYNGYVYGQCGTKRIKFDISDDVDRKIRNKR